MTHLALLLATAFAVAPAAAFATDPPSNQAAAPATPTTSFVAKVGVGNLFEIQSSQLALSRTKSSAVKDFANRMVTDHTAAAAKFKQALADAKLTAPPEKLDAEHQAILDSLKANQVDFDKAYIAAQYHAHVETVALFKAYASNGENGRMKAFAADLLPTLQGHLDHVSKMR